MSGFAPLRPLLLVLLACASTPLAAETRIEAPGGVAAQNITNSPISIGLSPDEQIHLVEVFLQRNAVTDEARAKAEARASELGAQLGFTREAVIGFFRILGEQDVSPEQIPLKLGEIAARHRAMLDRWSGTWIPLTRPPPPLPPRPRRRSTAGATTRRMLCLCRQRSRMRRLRGRRSSLPAMLSRRPSVDG